MRERSGAFLALALLGTLVTYRALPSVYFFGDDFLHLFSIVDADLFEYLLRPHGGHLLFTRNAIFVAFEALFGTNAAPYYIAALLTHLLNTGLLFRVVWNWTGSAPLAALGAVTWGTCPVHAATLTWYSVYGQVVVATILLFILSYGSARERAATAPSKAIIVAWPVLLIIASTCFGVGIGLLMAAPVALLCLFPASRPLRIACAVLAVIAVCTPTIYRALITYHSQLAGSADDLWKMHMALGGLHYRSTILTMWGYLFSAGAAHLLLSFASSAASFPSTASAAATIGYVVVVVAAFIVSPNRVRARAIGLLLLAGGCYGIIAAGRATLLPALKLAIGASIARYHYVGTVPLAILLCCSVAQLTRLLPRRTAVEVALLTIVLVIGTVLAVRAKPFVDRHDPARAEVQTVVAAIRAQIAQAPPGNEVRIVNRRFNSVGAMLGDPRAGFPGWAGIFVTFFPSNVIDGQRVRFVIDDPALLPTIATGRRTRDLFVVGAAPPAAQPPAPRPAL